MWFFLTDKDSAGHGTRQPLDPLVDAESFLEFHPDIEIVSGAGSIFEDVHENPGASRALERVLAKRYAGTTGRSGSHRYGMA